MILIGLGNVGREYENTHHNVGFMIMDEIARVNKLDFKLEKKFNAFIAQYIYNGEKHLLVKPTTYMNNSGIAIRSILDYYKLTNNDIFVFYDDLDLPLSTIRIRKSGSAGGHNGIKSIISHIGTQEFSRLRVGIKKEKEEIDTIDYVLSKFSKKELEQIEKTILIMPRLVDELLDNGVNYIMNHYNGGQNEI